MTKTARLSKSTGNTGIYYTKTVISNGLIYPPPPPPPTNNREQVSKNKEKAPTELASLKIGAWYWVQSPAFAYKRTRRIY